MLAGEAWHSNVIATWSPPAFSFNDSVRSVGGSRESHQMKKQNKKLNKNNWVLQDRVTEKQAWVSESWNCNSLPQVAKGSYMCSLWVCERSEREASRVKVVVPGSSVETETKCWETPDLKVGGRCQCEQCEQCVNVPVEETWRPEGECLSAAVSGVEVGHLQDYCRLGARLHEAEGRDIWWHTLGRTCATAWISTFLQWHWWCEKTGPGGEWRSGCTGQSHIATHDEPLC